MSDEDAKMMKCFNDEEACYETAWTRTDIDDYEKESEGDKCAYTGCMCMGGNSDYTFKSNEAWKASLFGYNAEQYKCMENVLGSDAFASGDPLTCTESMFGLDADGNYDCNACFGLCMVGNNDRKSACDYYTYWEVQSTGSDRDYYREAGAECAANCYAAKEECEDTGMSHRFSSSAVPSVHADHGHDRHHDVESRPIVGSKPYRPHYSEYREFRPEDTTNPSSPSSPTTILVIGGMIVFLLAIIATMLCCVVFKDHFVKLSAASYGKNASFE